MENIWVSAEKNLWTGAMFAVTRKRFEEGSINRLPVQTRTAGPQDRLTAAAWRLGFDEGRPDRPPGAVQGPDPDNMLLPATFGKCPFCWTNP
jgi:hypothetical protein